MRKVFGWMLGALLGLAVVRAADVSQVPCVSIGAEGLALKNWLVLGPFKASQGEGAGGVDFLASLGLVEVGWRTEDLVRVATQMGNPALKGKPSARVIENIEAVDFASLYSYRPQPGDTSETAVYVACEITAAANQEAWLLLGTDDGATVWLNGEQRYFRPGSHAMTICDDAVRLPLNPGKNLLLIKVAKHGADWTMTARLEPNATAAACTTLDRNPPFLKHVMVPRGELIQLTDRGLPDGAIFDAKLETNGGALIGSLQLEVNRPAALPAMSPGLYRIVLEISGRRYVQKFYFGGRLKDLHEDMLARRLTVSGDDRSEINLDTLLQRLDLLQAAPPPTREKGERFRQEYYEDVDYKGVYTAASIEDIIDQVTCGGEAFRHRPGLHIRGFRSRIDDQVLHYRLFVPSTYREDGPLMPMVIVMPTVFSGRRPYLASIFVSMHKEAEEWARAAEKLGLAILWPGYRSNPYGNPCDSAYLDEVLATVAADYRLDPARLYLYGICSAGMTTSMEAVRHPERFAGIAYLNPVLRRLKNRYDDNGEFAEFPAYRAWLNSTDPVMPLAGLPDIPIWIIHDGMDPGHGPLGHSVDFVEAARAMGNRPRFDRNKTSPPVRFTLHEQQLAWLAKQHREEAKPLDFSLNAPSGPLSTVFAGRFILVEATGGTAADRAANQKLSADFQEAWRGTNVVSCRVTTDRQLASEEEKQSNLVLLGNAETNLVWQRLAPQLPVTITGSEIAIEGHSVQGKALALQAWFPHPEQPGKRIALLGGTALGKVSFGTLELALDGWFDYSIWDTESGEPVLLTAERYR